MQMTLDFGPSRQDRLATNQQEQIALWRVAQEQGEFVRIATLEDAPQDAGHEPWIDDLHLPQGSMKLTPIQRAALSSIRRLDTVVGSMGVGTGKTLVLGLAPKALGIPGKDVVLLLPPSLIKTAQAEFDKYRSHFDIDPPQLLSYSKMSSKKHPRLLEQMNPKAVLADEAHYLRNANAARTKRVFRFLKDKKNWNVPFIPVSGTLIQKSVKDAYHLFSRALGFRSPLPRDWNSMNALALCSDELPRHDGTVASDLEHQNILPLTRKYGLRFGDASIRGKRQVRKAIEKRIATCDGVVQTTEASARQSIYRHDVSAKVSQELREHIQTLDETWCTPDGQPLREAVHLVAAKRQLAVGFYYRMEWGPEGPNIPWLVARSEYNTQLRTFLKYRGGHHDLDTPASVEDHLSTGSFPLDPLLLQAYQTWKDIEPTANPYSVPCWIDRSILDHAKKMTEKKKGILWFDWICVGDELRKMGMETYQAGEEIPTHTKRPIACSIKAHGTGKNLQTWDTNIILTPPSSATTWEQLIGRTHRLGQAAQQIDVFIYANTNDQKTCVYNALRGAKYIHQTTGQQQKLLLSSFIT